MATQSNTAIQNLQAKLDASKPKSHWSDVIKTKYYACSVPDWVRKQKSLKDAWKKCERTDWMMWLLKKVMCEYAYGSVERRTMEFELQWMANEFRNRWKSRHDGGPSSINSTHLGHSKYRKAWTSAERMKMTDFIRYYFPTPEFQKRKPVTKKK